jgi:hypothetical protein
MTCIAKLEALPARTMFAVDAGLTGHGEKPFRLVLWLAAAWVLNTIIFSCNADRMAPTNAALLQNGDLRKACLSAPGGVWTNCNQQGMTEYPKFYAPLYALDVLVPIMDLQQSRLWQPISGDGGWGAFAFFWRCLAGIFGWVLGVALGSLALKYVGAPKEWSAKWAPASAGKETTAQPGIRK